MPHKSNDKIAEIIVREGWFQSEVKEGTPSDNWRVVQDTEGRKALLYVVRFLSQSQPIPDEMRTIPNKPTTLVDIAAFHQKIGSPGFGPFIALAEDSSNGIVWIRMWNLLSLASSGKEYLKVAELGRPIHEYLSRHK